MKQIIILAFLVLNSTLNYAQSIKPLAQYPSPMSEDVRPHHRLPEIKYPGYNFQVDSLLTKPVNIYVIMVG